MASREHRAPSTETVFRTVDASELRFLAPGMVLKTPGNHGDELPIINW